MNEISAARRAAHLSVEEVAARTRIALRYVEAIDAGRLSDLPSGIYGRAYVRAVADVVGIEGEPLHEVLAALVPAPDPLPALQEVRAPRRSWPIFPMPHLPQMPPMPGGVRVHVAAAVDAAVLLAIGTAVVLTIAAACGLAPAALVRMAPGPVAVLCVGIFVLYFVLLGGVNGCTVGQLACGIGMRDVKPLRLGEIAQRALGIDPNVTDGGAAPAGLRHSTADPVSPA